MSVELHRTAAGFPRFSETEYRNRIALVRKLMEREGVHALLVHGSGGAGAPIHYLTNYPGVRPTWLLFPAEGESTLLLQFQNHIPNAVAMTVAGEIGCYQPSAAAAVAAEIRKRGLDSAGVGIVGLGASIPFAQFDELRRLLPSVRFSDLGRRYSELRWIRSAEELAWIRNAAGMADAACRRLSERIRPGMSEYELESIIHDAVVPQGGQVGIAFLSSTSMGASDRCSPWQFLAPRKIEKGDVITTELSVNFWGYGAQIHRPYAVGAPPNDLYRRLYDAALECFEAVREVLVPGATGEDVIRAGACVEQRGFLLFDSLCHGEGGRNPELGASGSGHAFESWEFKENQVMVIQPNPVTHDRTAGLQLGSSVRVGPKGGEVLHAYPFEFTVCG